MAELGRINTLIVTRSTLNGFYLDGGALGEMLLPTRYVPRGLGVGEFAAMRVKDIHPRAGAFLDWGLPKDLMLPYREQKPKVSVGEEVVVAVILDGDGSRIIATTFLTKHLSREHPPYGPGDPVDLLVCAQTDLGYNAIVGGRFRGLLYHTNLAGPLRVGARMGGFVKLVREDGKIDLSIDEAGYARVAPLSERILEELARVGGRLNFDDSSDPESIRVRFGVSKKAFKQALGALYRARRIEFTLPGIQLCAPGREGRP